MSAEIVNLRRVRKAKARAADKDMALARRARFGRSKDDRAGEEVERSRRDRQLDGAKLSD